MRSDDAKKGVIDYMTIEDTAGVLYIANLGCIEFHPLHSRCDDVGHPDYLFFDLDPFPPYTYEDVLQVARHIKILLDQLGLTAFPKTSGATGMQIYMPLERGRYTYEEARAFVGACGRLILGADPDRVTMAWKIADRTGKIFIDHNMNRQGANIAAAYSMRPELRAPVSTPLTWDEVEQGGFVPQDFRIDNVWDRFATGRRPVRRRPHRGDGPDERDGHAGRRRRGRAAAPPLPAHRRAEGEGEDLRGDRGRFEGPEPDGVRAPQGLRGHAGARARRRPRAPRATRS